MIDPGLSHSWAEPPCDATVVELSRQARRGAASTRTGASSPLFGPARKRSWRCWWTGPALCCCPRLLGPDLPGRVPLSLLLPRDPGPWHEVAHGTRQQRLKPRRHEARRAVAVGHGELAEQFSHAVGDLVQVDVGHGPQRLYPERQAGVDRRTRVTLAGWLRYPVRG